MSSAKEVVALAVEELGYIEKASNSNLENKTANAGSGNWTKYGAFLDSIPNFYNGKKNGYSWCDVWVDYLFVKAFGVEEALRLLCQPYGSAGAGCLYSKNYYANKGRFYTSNPQIGDQIFFRNSSDPCSHTGLVVEVNGSRVTTIEGNSSDKVQKCSYSVSDWRIVGYGRPAYSEGTVGSISLNDSVMHITTIKQVQSFLKVAESGLFDIDTKRALIKKTQEIIGAAQTGTFTKSDAQKFGILYKGDIGSKVKILQCALICNTYSVGADGADGEYGENTEAGVKKYQTETKIEIDGRAGPETIYSLLGY